jgi:hypothetical protein
MRLPPDLDELPNYNLRVTLYERVGRLLQVV